MAEYLEMGSIQLWRMAAGSLQHEKTPDGAPSGFEGAIVRREASLRTFRSEVMEQITTKSGEGFRAWILGDQHAKSRSSPPHVPERRTWSRAEWTWVPQDLPQGPSGLDEASGANNAPGMRRLLLCTLALSAFLGDQLAAAPWQPINERKAVLEYRINEGIRNGVLTRAEAVSLRSEFSALERLEVSYRRSGGHFSAAERMDLDKRFDALALRIKIQRRDSDVRARLWVSLTERRPELDRRIDHGVRRGLLSRPDAIQLRGELSTLIKLEAEYRRSRGHLSQDERADLDRRFDRLSRRISAETSERRSRF
jgi:hypothetical protein